MRSTVTRNFFRDLYVTTFYKLTQYILRSRNFTVFYYQQALLFVRAARKIASLFFVSSKVCRESARKMSVTAD